MEVYDTLRVPEERQSPFLLLLRNPREGARGFRIFKDQQAHTLFSSLSDDDGVNPVIITYHVTVTQKET